MDRVDYQPMMSPEYAEVLRTWHERAAAELSSLEPHEMHYLGLDLAIPEYNAERNGLQDRTTFIEGDLFDRVDGQFDVIIYDPPFRWFRPRTLLELAFADEGYRSLSRFMSEVGERLTDHGRVLLFFGTSGDIAYLHHLIDQSGLHRETIELRDLDKDGITVRYLTYRLSAAS